MQINHPLRTRQDADGQWWYLHSPKKNSWTKVFPRRCPVCGVEYVGAYRAKSQMSENCSRRCGATASHKANPGRFSRENGGRWKGGRRLDQRGYVLVNDREAYLRHGGTSPTKCYVLEHRLVMEKKLGRYLQPNETVHHKNGNRADNRPENLELWVKWQPSGARSGEVKHCPTCTCGVTH